LIVDHEPEVRRLLKKILQREIPRVLEASTGRDAIDLAAAEAPGVIVLDLALPDMRWIDVCREIRRWSSAWIVGLSAGLSDRDKARLFAVGGDDYVTKPFSTLELAARIRAHRRRLAPAPRPLANEPVTIGDLIVNLSARTVRRGNESIHLTPTEWVLLRLFLAHVDCTLTHGQVLEAIWGSASNARHLSLRVHIANLRRKLESDPMRPRLIMTEPAVGYRCVGSPHDIP
jgi:two-component system KDP operon response regulator KdpE